MSPEQRGELWSMCRDGLASASRIQNISYELLSAKLDAMARDLADKIEAMDSLSLTSRPFTHPVDWEGKPIPPDEPADKIIKVWETTPATNDDHTHNVTRSWRELKQILTDIQDDHLDSMDEQELREGFVFTVKLKEMTVGEYKEICDGDY